jgi:Phage protein Gp138 N-terminal domain
MADAQEQAFKGHQPLETFGSDFNAQAFLIKSMLANVRTATIVKVISCTNDGGLSPVGLVDVQPLINQVDGHGNQTAMPQIHSCPYFRLQGGANGIIIDPEPGDLGIAIIADRDISNVISTKKQSGPGTGRKMDLADGMYIGGILNGVPTQYVQLNAQGISIKSTAVITVTDGAGSVVVMGNDGTGTMTFPSGLTVNANIQVNGAVVATGEGTFNGGHTVSQHTHTQPNDSHNDSEQPTDKPEG